MATEPEQAVSGQSHERPSGVAPGGLFLVRQALARNDWGFEGLRAEHEGCAARQTYP